MAEQVDDIPGWDEMPDDPTTEIPVPEDKGPYGYGYKKDGTPYKRDPARYKQRDAKKATGPARKIAGPRAASARKTPTRKRNTYKADVLGTIQLVMAPLGLLAMKEGPTGDMFAADFVTVEHYAEPLAEGIADVAEKNEKLAAILDKLGEVGPYGAILAVAVPMAFQLLCNHGVLPPGIAGTQDPAALAASIQGRPEPAPYEPPTGPAVEDSIRYAGGGFVG